MKFMKTALKLVSPPTPEEERRAVYNAEKAAQLRARRLKTPEKFRAYDRARYAAASPEKKRLELARVQAIYHAHPEKRKAHNIKRYGLTLEAFKILLEVQGDKCAICRKPFSSDRKTHVDHDHVSGRVRGLLCHGCNIGLGSFRDSPETLNLAADYLQKASSTP